VRSTGMRGFTLSLVAVIALSSCTTRQRVAGGGAGLALVGVYLGFSTESKDEDEIGTREKIGIGCLLTGLATLFVAAALEESASNDDAKPREIKAKPPAGPDPAAAAAQQKRDQAWGLTKQAQDAARVNDCAKVTELSAQVGSLDRDFYADVFMKDVAIQQCFTPAPAENPPPPPVTP
jgi:hypothetical protein